MLYSACIFHASLLVEELLLVYSSLNRTYFISTMELLRAFRSGRTKIVGLREGGMVTQTYCLHVQEGKKCATNDASQNRERMSAIGYKSTLALALPE